MYFPSSPATVTEEERSLFLGDLSCFCQDSDVYQFFRGVGEIATIRLIRDKATNKCAGYGFITFVDKNVLPSAIRLDGQVLLGRRVKIGLANPRKPLTGGATSMVNEMNPRPHLKPKDSSKPPAQLHFSYLSQQVRYRVTEETIRNVFSRFGEVVDVTIKKTGFVGSQQSGYGFVHFTLDHSGIKAAIQATSVISQVVIDDVLYDSCLSRSLAAALQSSVLPLQGNNSWGTISAATTTLLNSKQLSINNERAHFSSYYPHSFEKAKEIVFPNCLVTASNSSRSITPTGKEKTSYCHSNTRVASYNPSQQISIDVSLQSVPRPSRNPYSKNIGSF